MCARVDSTTNESLRKRVVADLDAIRRNPRLVRSFLAAPSAAQVVDQSVWVLAVPPLHIGVMAGRVLMRVVMGDGCEGRLTADR